jgi:CRISPR/Cas system-associated exonuclease Cas4 (RecB family)
MHNGHATPAAVTITTAAQSAAVVIAPAAGQIQTTSPIITAERPISVSQAKTFLRCSAKWWYDLIERKRQNVALAIGDAVHQAIAAAMTAKREGQQIEAADAGNFAMMRARDLLQMVECSQREFVFGCEDAERCTAAWMRSQAQRINPAGIEEAFETKIGGVPVRGAIDLIHIDPATDTPTLIEIKTASPRRPITPTSHTFQLATYATARNIQACEVHTIRKLKTPTCEITPQTITEPDLQYVNNIYPAINEAMQTGVYLPNRDHILCTRRWCEHWAACESDFGGKVRE